MLKQLDIVRILSTKDIRFLSGPAGQAANPQGFWSVVGFVGTDILIAKDETLVRAPLYSVEKVMSFITDISRNKLYGQKRTKKDGTEKRDGSIPRGKL